MSERYGLHFRVTKSSKRRRYGWRGWIDFMLRRKPVTIIEGADVIGVEKLK